MTRLEDLQLTAAVRGILPEQTVTVVSVQWFGSEALELTYKGPSGRVANELLYRHDEPRLQVVEHCRPWSFDARLSALVIEPQYHCTKRLFWGPKSAVETRGRADPFRFVVGYLRGPWSDSFGRNYRP